MEEHGTNTDTFVVDNGFLLRLELKVLQGSLCLQTHDNDDRSIT